MTPTLLIFFSLELDIAVPLIDGDQLTCFLNSQDLSLQYPVHDYLTNAIIAVCPKPPQLLKFIIVKRFYLLIFSQRCFDQVKPHAIFKDSYQDYGLRIFTKTKASLININL